MISMCITGRQSGRVQLKCEIDHAGNDMRVFLYGGMPHIGAIALACPDGTADCIELAGHKEGRLARSLAVKLAVAIKCNVAVTCGIHYDKISSREIEEVEMLAAELGEQITAILTNENKKIIGEPQ